MYLFGYLRNHLYKELKYISNENVTFIFFYIKDQNTFLKL